MSKAITEQELCSVIGEELFQKCSDKFSGRQYYFKKKPNPLNFNSQQEKENFIYNACIKSGASFDDVADKVQLSPERVKRIFYQKLKEGKSNV